MINDQDFLLLLAQDKEALIALIIQLMARVEELEKPLELPELPPCGQYVVKDSKGIVCVMEEDNFLRSQVEAMAILLSLDGYAVVQFCLNGRTQLVSEWSQGRRVVRC